MSKFKVGDVVRRTGYNFGNLKVGDVKVITNTNEGNSLLMFGDMFKYYAKQFELVEEFTHQKLLTGDILVRRDGKKLIVLKGTGQGDITVGVDASHWQPLLSNYNKDTFEECTDSDLDIMSVLRPASNMSYHHALTKTYFNSDTIWKRVEKSEAQIEKESIEAEMQALKDRLTALDVQ